MAAFAEKMNALADSLGPKNTHVVEPGGYDWDGQYSTAEDLAIIARAFLDHAELREKCAAVRLTERTAAGDQFELSNTNRLIDPASGYYEQAAFGVKTGSTHTAGGCLISVFTAGGHEYLCIVMGSGYDDRYTDTKALMRAME